jgi:hypothetical protein
MNDESARAGSHDHLQLLGRALHTHGCCHLPQNRIARIAVAACHRAVSKRIGNGLGVLGWNHETSLVGDDKVCGRSYGGRGHDRNPAGQRLAYADPMASSWQVDESVCCTVVGGKALVWHVTGQGHSLPKTPLLHRDSTARAQGTIANEGEVCLRAASCKKPEAIKDEDWILSLAHLGDRKDAKAARSRTPEHLAMARQSVASTAPPG